MPITTLCLHLSPFERWTTHLSAENEKKYRLAADGWNLAQKATIASVCMIGIAILTTPFLAPVSYSSLLMTTFSFAPIFFPIPLCVYNYCSTQTEKTARLVKKILFLQSEHVKIAQNPSAGEEAFKETFGKYMSEEKKLLFKQTEKNQVPVLSHIAFIQKELSSLKKELEEKRLNTLYYVEKDLEALLKNPNFSSWQSHLAELKDLEIEKRTGARPSKLLLTLIGLIKEANDRQQASELGVIYWKWFNLESVSAEEKWLPVFKLEEKILACELERIFLWTFLFGSENDFSSSLERYQIEIEESLYELGKKQENSLAALSIGKAYGDVNAERAFLVAGEVFSRDEILRREKRELVLDKLLAAAESRSLSK